MSGKSNSVDLTLLALRLAFGVTLLGLWEWGGRTYGHAWTSLPSLIYERIVEWVQSDLAMHVSFTLQEIVIGLVIGGTAGALLGLSLGRARTAGAVLRPIIFGLYSIPIIALAPLFILWFGLGMMPKIVLVMISAFFLLFFNTFSGVQGVDSELVSQLRLMGANPQEEFRHLVVPATMPWIVGGFKIAVPYAFAAAVTGELLAARYGMGALLSEAAAQFDMTGLYAGLLVLMIMGMVGSALTLRAERWLLRWRAVAE